MNRVRNGHLRILFYVYPCGRDESRPYTRHPDNLTPGSGKTGKGRHTGKTIPKIP